MPDFITTAEAASRKGCTRQAIINAIARGDVNAQKLGPVWAVADDAALAAYVVRETGGRTHRGKGAETLRLGSEAEGVEAVAATGVDVSANT